MEITENKIEELVFSDTYSIQSFIKSATIATNIISVHDLIIELGDCPITDKCLALLIQAMEWISKVNNLHLDIFACHCNDFYAISILNVVLLTSEKEGRNLKKVKIDMSENGFSQNVVVTLLKNL